MCFRPGLRGRKGFDGLGFRVEGLKGLGSLNPKPFGGAIARLRHWSQVVRTMGGGGGGRTEKPQPKPN